MRIPTGVLMVIIAAAISVEGAAAAVRGGGLLDDVPEGSEVLEGYEPDEVRGRLAESPLHSVEGLWEFASEGTLMAIERVATPEGRRGGNATLYRMVAVRGADMALRPGTVMGYLATTSRRGVYDARIYTSRHDDGRQLSAPRTFTLTLTDEDSRLTIKEYGKKYVFNWWRLLPYMYRYVVSRREREAGDIDGCMRVFPEPSRPLEPRYL